MHQASMCLVVFSVTSLLLSLLVFLCLLLLLLVFILDNRRCCIIALCFAGDVAADVVTYIGTGLLLAADRSVVTWHNKSFMVYNLYG